MAIPIDQLVNSGALTYAQTRLSRGDSPAEVLGRLGRRYPSQPTSDLQYLIEIAIAEEALRAEIAAGDRLQPIGPAQIPLVPGLPAGTYEIDVAYTVSGRPGRAGQRGFFRTQLDSLDLLIGLLFAVGSVKQGADAHAGYWRGIRDMLSDVPEGTLVGDLSQIFPDVIGEVPPSIATEQIPVAPTRAALSEAIVRIPEDEPEQIIFPPQWVQSPRSKKILEAKVLFLGRG